MAVASPLAPQFPMTYDDFLAAMGPLAAGMVSTAGQNTAPSTRPNSVFPTMQSAMGGMPPELAGLQTFTNPSRPGEIFVLTPSGIYQQWNQTTKQVGPIPGMPVAGIDFAAPSFLTPELTTPARPGEFNPAPFIPPTPTPTTVPSPGLPTADLAPQPPVVTPPAVGAGAGVPTPVAGPAAVQNPVPPDLAPPAFPVIPPVASGPVASPVSSVLAPQPVLPPVSQNITPADLGIPPTPAAAAPATPPAPPVNEPQATPLPPPPPPMPAPSSFNPLQALASIQASAAPPPMASPIAGNNSPLAPITPPNSANQMAATPQVSPLDAGLPSPLAPMSPPPGPPTAMPGNPLPGPVQAQTLAEAVGGQPQANLPPPGTASAPAGTPGLSPQAGGDTTSIAPLLAPPGEEAGPQAIPFRPNTPTAATPNLSPNASIEDFMGNLGGLQFGAEGILGVPGGPKRATGQSEADFMRSLLSSGLLGGRL